MKYPKYEQYKDSGSKYINELPDYWTTSAIKYLVCTPITDGPHETPDFLEDGIPFISAEAIENGRINFNKKRDCISEEQHKIYSKKYKPQRNDVYVVKSGSTTGKVAIVDTDEEFNIWSPLAAIRVNPEKNDPYFLFYALCSDLFQKQVSLFWSFGTQPNIGMSVLQKLKIPIPSLQEQQSIANFLDKETSRLDALIAKKQQLIESLKEKRIAIISQAVTKGLNPDVKMKDSGIEWLGEVPKHWEVKKLKYNVSKVGSGVTPEGGATIYEDEGIPLIRSQNVYSNGLKIDDVVYISEEIHNNMNNSKVKKGDILLNITGASLGRCFYMDDTFTEANVNQHVCIIRPILNKLATKHLHLLLISEAGQEQIWNNQTGSGREGLNFVSIKNFSFAYPPTIEEQEEIIDDVAQKTNKIDLLFAKTEEAITKLQEYKTALISAAVTGKIKIPEQA